MTFNIPDVKFDFEGRSVLLFFVQKMLFSAPAGDKPDFPEIKKKDEEFSSSFQLVYFIY